MSNDAQKRVRRLGIVGAGSSGLISLYYAKQELSDWDVVVFERSDSVAGCWGRPYPGFVSTSTKFTTQFACYPVYSANVKDDGGVSRNEFFCEGEYGDYLESFARDFNLTPHVRFRHDVRKVTRNEAQDVWNVLVRDLTSAEPADRVELFDAVILCTGLAAEPKPVTLDVPCVSAAQLRQPDGVEQIRNCKVVIMGGGESAVDHASRLAREDLGNEVFLSLQSGIRVSPRYHPIRGVPSDFLRNRLMLSIHESMRNWIGQRFVEARILYEDKFRKIFPSRHSTVVSAPDSSNDSAAESVRKEWGWRLTRAAKDDLFNMFHNKSDGFLDLVGQNRIRIIGPPRDRSANEFYEFQSSSMLKVSPDWIVPSIGYRSTIEELSEGQIRVADFYLGCQSVRFSGLYLVGFARPIIGNIPSISEMQAAYVCGLITGKFTPDTHLVERHQSERRLLEARFAKLNLNAIYPVEMFPYCDELAHRMKCMPTWGTVGSIGDWLRLHCAPASTLQYFWSNPRARLAVQNLPVYMPWLLIAILLLLKPIDACFRAWKGLRHRVEYWQVRRSGTGRDFHRQ